MILPELYGRQKYGCINRLKPRLRYEGALQIGLGPLSFWVLWFLKWIKSDGGMGLNAVRKIACKS